MLEVSALQAGYGPAQVLFDVSFHIKPSEVVSLLGRNGMGKTTTIRALMGLIPVRGGDVSFEGKRLTGSPPYRVAQAGLGLVPEGRQVFPTLTVEENLVATAADRSGRGRFTLEATLRAVPPAEGTTGQLRQPALRRRAADAGGRAGADDQSEAPDPRRGDGGPRAADPRRDLGGAREPSGGRPVDPRHRTSISRR